MTRASRCSLRMASTLTFRPPPWPSAVSATAPSARTTTARTPMSAVRHAPRPVPSMAATSSGRGILACWRRAPQSTGRRRGPGHYVRNGSPSCGGRTGCKPGEASFVDPHTLAIRPETGAGRVTAANIVIAVGTVPAPTPGVKPDGEIILDPDQIIDLRQLPRTLAVVGAGVIGIEYASMFAALGVRVTVIDQRPRPLEFLDQEIGDELLHQLRNSDILFRCGDAVEHIDIVQTPQRQGLIRLASGKYLVAEVILFSAGRVGATEALHLEAVGLAADARGRLQVDSSYRTAVEHIWAVGDVIGFPALAATSSEQGRLAACAMFGVDAEAMASHFPVGIYALPEVSMVGATEEELTRQKIPYETGIARYKEISRG